MPSSPHTFRSLAVIATIRSSPMPPPSSAMGSRTMAEGVGSVRQRLSRRPGGWTHVARPVRPCRSSCRVPRWPASSSWRNPLARAPRTQRTGRGGDISSRNGIKDPCDRRCGRSGTRPCHTVARPLYSTPGRASRGVGHPPPSRGHRPLRSRHARFPCRAVSPPRIDPGVNRRAQGHSCCGGRSCARNLPDGLPVQRPVPLAPAPERTDSGHFCHRIRRHRPAAWTIAVVVPPEPPPASAIFRPHRAN